ncbi:MAG TPA: SAM-dependent methyltransferase [Vicinamibacterales bacterium]|nr:SAM-dependent methyltransferase [Vicinamibacterales bacterium]
MELALYHPEFGYYARAGQRSGRAGDFFTSVDVGAVFGELLEAQCAEMFRLLESSESANSRTRNPDAGFDLVEAGAGNGRLSADMLRAARATHPEFYRAIRLHLVEASPAARADQHATLGDVVDRLVSSSDALPDSFEGVLVANELLDAMPVHQVTMTEDGLKEVYVNAQLSTLIAPPSTPRLQEYLDRVGVRLQPGWRVEVNLHAVDWIRSAARRLGRGFIVLVDYGHEARELYSASHSAGTLTTFSGHRAGDGDAWLQRPGEQDITSHVDWTSVRAAAEAEGMQTIAFLDQTYFVLGLLSSLRDPQSALRKIKTLLMPGGLGSTMKVLILGKGVGTPQLLGTSFKVRAT